MNIRQPTSGLFGNVTTALTGESGSQESCDVSCQCDDLADDFGILSEAKDFGSYPASRTRTEKQGLVIETAACAAIVPVSQQEYIGRLEPSWQTGQPHGVFLSPVYQSGRAPLGVGRQAGMVPGKPEKVAHGGLRNP